MDDIARVQIPDADVETIDVKAVNTRDQRAPLFASRVRIHPKRAEGRFRRLKWGVMAATLAPAALVTTPGSYRLTVVDPVRQVGDALVVASAGSVIAPGGVVSRITVPRGNSTSTVFVRPAVTSTAKSLTRSL